MSTVTSSLNSYPTAYTTSGSINGTNYRNAVGKGSDTSAASGNDYSSGGSSSTAYVAYSFDFSGIPAGATVDSVSCTVKGHCENTSRSTANLQLYAGSTAKGSVSKFTTTSAQTVTLTTGTWTRAEIDEMTLRFTMGYYGGLVNGATVTVTFSYDAITYTVTATTSVGTIEPSGESTLISGEPYLLTIIETTEAPQVTDNGTDVTSQLVQKNVPTGGTMTAVPAAYQTSGSISGSNYQNAVGQGSDTSSTSGNDYASSSTATINYSFDVSSIPANATITAFSCTVKGHCESTSQSSEQADIALYCGSTVKSNQESFESTSDTVETLTGTTITREELDNLVLRFTIGYYGGRVSGATLSVTYTVPSTGYDYYWEYTIASVTENHTIIVGATGGKYIRAKVNGSWIKIPVTNGRAKVGGTWRRIVKAYANVNGAWKEMT